jgi:hypothetical protein
VAALLLATPPALAEEDPRDWRYVSSIVNDVLENERSKVEIPWSNSETGSRGIIVVERTYYRDSGTPCRDYRRTSERTGQAVLAISGTGCRTGPGRWQLDERSAATPSTGSPAAPASVPKYSRDAPATAAAPVSPPEGSRPSTDPPAAEKPAAETRAIDRPVSDPPAREKPASQRREHDRPATAATAPKATPKPPTFPAYTLPSKADL